MGVPGLRSRKLVLHVESFSFERMERFWGWTVVQENLNEVSKEHMSDFGEEVTNRLKLRRRLSWKHIFREGDCYKDYGKGRA